MLLASVDDKAHIPIGEPDLPVQAVTRQRPVAAVGGQPITAADHVHVKYAKATPSCTLVTEIPDSASESFHRGQLHVHLKVSWQVGRGRTAQGGKRAPSWPGWRAVLRGKASER